MSEITRRQFIRMLSQGLALVGLAAITTPVVAFFFPAKLEEMPTEPVPVGSEADLPENESTTIGFGRYPALVIHTSEGLKAYSAVCTHFACIVKWNKELGQIACPCHEGYFDPLDGSVLAGPPPAPLLSLPVQVIDGQIYIGGEA